jgi:hypothetical protein
MFPSFIIKIFSWRMREFIIKYFSIINYIKQQTDADKNATSIAYEKGMLKYSNFLNTLA